MIVDSSVLIAILMREQGHEDLYTRIGDTGFVGVSAATMVEAGMVLTARLGPIGPSLLDRLVREAKMTIVALTEDHWAIAVGAFALFGKGRHPAGLNFGDCLSYATVTVAQLPLFCIGDDFPQTDLDLVRG